MSYFEENIKVIKRRDIVLYEQLQLRQDYPIDRVEAAAAKDGNSYLKVRLHGQWIAFNSTYYPMKEAWTFSKKYESMPPYSRILFLGFGNGCFCRALLKCNQRNASYKEMEDGAKVKYAFYEPDSQIFLYVMHMYDLTDILSNEDVFIFVEGMNGNLLSGWCNRNLAVLNEKTFFIDALPKYAGEYGDAYARINAVYQKARETMKAFANTKRLLGKKTAKNSIYNLAFAGQSRNLSVFMERYPKALPYVIVSAGPSLKNSLELLKLLQGKSFIMSTDTAASYLLAHGICPDGIICLDPAKLVKLFSVDMKEIPFFAHTEANYEVLDLIHPRKLYFAASYIDYYRHLARQRGSDIPDMDPGASVATFAYAFAAQLQVEYVILTGQDLCVTEHESHAVSVVNRTQSEKPYIQVPGNIEATVNTYDDFYVYLQWFQDNIPKSRRVKVINATVGGARIEGTQYMNSDEAAAFVSGLHTEDVYQEFVYSVLNVAEAGKYDTSIYEGIQRQNKDIMGLLQQGHLLLEGSRHISSDDAAQGYLSIVEQLQEIQRQLALIPEFELVEHACMDVIDEYMAELNQTAPGSEVSVQKILSVYEQYYMLLIEGAKEVSFWCEEAKNR